MRETATQLLDYLKTQSGFIKNHEIISNTSIYDSFTNDGVGYRGTKKTRMASDVSDINHNQEIDYIVLPTMKGYKIANNPDEAKKFRNKLVKELKQKVAYLKVVDKKIANNHQLAMDQDEIKVIETYLEEQNESL